MPKEKELKAKQAAGLLEGLKARFEKNMDRHQGVEWAKVQARLEANAEKLWSLHEMERTGGEPDVVGHDKKTGEYIFFDCSAESPKGRRSLCYDREALESRKEHKPENSARRYGSRHGHRALDGGTVSRAAEARRIRHEDVELGENAVAISESSAAPSFAIAATTLFSCITTARSLTMPPGGSGARSGSSEWGFGLRAALRGGRPVPSSRR